MHEIDGLRETGKCGRCDGGHLGQNAKYLISLFQARGEVAFIRLIEYTGWAGFLSPPLPRAHFACEFHLRVAAETTFISMIAAVEFGNRIQVVLLPGAARPRTAPAAMALEPTAAPAPITEF